MRNILAGTFVVLMTLSARAQPADIALPDILSVEMPKGVSQIGPSDSPLRELLAAAHSTAGTVTTDLQGKIGIGPVRVTFSAWKGSPGSGKPAATRVARLFILPAGMTPVGVSADENATGGNNTAHIARDSGGYVHMIWQDGGRPGAPVGPVYRRAAVGPDGKVYLETDPIYIADSGPSDWNAYPGLATSGRDVQLVWQGGGTARTRRVSRGPNGWMMGPISDTGVKSTGRDIGDAIVFDGKGGLHLVTPDGFYAFSGDGGKSWSSEAIPLPANERIKTQSVAVDPAGTVHIAFSAVVTRPNPAAEKLGGYWQLRTISRTADGRWTDATNVLANDPAWKELQGQDDMLADWARIAADKQGGLHIAWHGTALSHAYGHDSAFYAWKTPGGAWSAPVLLVPPDSTRGIKYSFAPSLAVDGDRALALVFYDVYQGSDWLAFDSALATLRRGRMETPLLSTTQFAQAAKAARHPETAMGPRFPAVAPAPWHAADGHIWLDVLETLQSAFQPSGTHLIVYQRLDMTAPLHKP